MLSPDDDGDALEINDRMLHRERAEFESGMGFFPPVTIALCVLCTLAFIAELATGALASEEKIVAAGAMHAPEVRAGEFWRLASAMFLHGGPDHLIGNLVVLYVLGMAGEHAFGRGQFLVLYVLAGLAGSGLGMIGGLPSVGASGAVFGAAGGMVAFFVRHHRAFRVRDARMASVLAVWAVYQFVLGSLNPIIDNWAHVGGFFGGLLVGFVMDRRLGGGSGGDLSRPGQLISLLAVVGFLAYTAVNFIPRLLN